MSGWISIREMSAVSGMSEYTLAKYARTNVIPARKHGRNWRFQSDRVERVLTAKFGNKALQSEVLK